MCHRGSRGPAPGGRSEAVGPADPEAVDVGAGVRLGGFIVGFFGGVVGWGLGGFVVGFFAGVVGWGQNGWANPPQWEWMDAGPLNGSLPYYDLDPQKITGTGRDGRITKADVLTFLRSRPAEQEPARSEPAATPRAEPPRITPGLPQVDEDRPQKRVPMSRLRARIAERMLHASQSTAMLTTFNDVNMQPVMALLCFRLC